MNKGNIEAIQDDKEYSLKQDYHLRKGENRMKLIIKNTLTNLKEMFFCYDVFGNIDELKYLKTNGCTYFNRMFCFSHIENEKPLEKWDVSKCENFIKMFYGCESLSI